MNSYEEIKAAVNERMDVLTVSMETLRNIHGVAKLGVHVRANISNALASRGLGHFPDPLPDRQNAEARLYTLGSPACDFINAVLNVGESNDSVIRKAVSNAHSDVLRKIRELLDEED